MVALHQKFSAGLWPERIGKLTMRNLDITDSRAKQGIYAHTGLLSVGEGPHIYKLDGNGKK
jgi:argininosuccinate synthase